MASLTALYWRDMPTQVIAKAGRTTAKREPPDRFTKAIDAAANLEAEYDQPRLARLIQNDGREA